VFLSKQEIDPKEFDLSCVKQIIAGAAVFPTSITNALLGKFTNVQRPIHQVMIPFLNLQNDRRLSAMFLFPVSMFRRCILFLYQFDC
jgi:hypothetical protein